MKKINTHLKYGGITGFVMVIISLLIYIIDSNLDSGLSMIVYVPLIVGLIMNAMAYSKANDHFVTFGNVFSSCFKASAIIAIIMVAWSALSVIIFPEMKEKGMEIAYQQMSQNNAMTQEQIDEWMKMTNKYYTAMTIGAVMFGMMFWGAIISLLAAAIAKKKGTGFPQ